MSEDGVKKVLQDFGLTQKETEIYIFLAKHGPIKGGEIVKRTKTHRALIYRILGSLQKKGLVESTLESPSRFQAIPFEAILDQSIKTKKEEAAQIENKKAELLNYWNKTSQIEPDTSPEKFSVIEGQNRIHAKIFQLIKETRNQLSMILNNTEFIRIVQLGFFETDKKQLNSKVQYRLLTDLPIQNSRTAKEFLKETSNNKAFFEIRIPDFGLGFTPRMLIRDEDEAMVFLSINQDKALIENDQTCLCTNSKALIQSFKDTCEGLWKNSTDFQNKSAKSEGGTIAPHFIQNTDSESTWKKYEEIVNSAKKSIFIFTSPDGLRDFSDNIILLKCWSSKGIIVKMMAPITNDNFNKTQELMKFCEIRHIQNSTTNSLTLVDGKYLFQSYRPIQTQKKISTIPLIGFTNNADFIKKTEIMLKELWKNAIIPSIVNMEYIRKKTSANFQKRSSGVTTPLCRLNGYSIVEEKKPTETDIINRIMTAKKQIPTISSKEAKAYCIMGQAVIHPPQRFNLPDLLMFVQHFEKRSSFGEEDGLIISLWLETPNGFSYVPVAIVQNSPSANEIWKRLYDKTPAGKNVQLVKNEDLEIRLHGNTFFASWSNPIPLLLPKYVLPTGCIILETYGQVQINSYTLVAPSGFRSKIEGNGFYAFVTFLSSTANYTGPGTDGYVTRDAIMTTTPPSNYDFKA
jgi:sugar-specific transcriptional regulator TrmB